MKLSDLTKENVLKLTPAEKWETVLGGVCDKGECAEFALLLGTKPSIARERALTAAKLYSEGRVKYIIPSGGVAWEGWNCSEAEYMAQVLLNEGVPQDAIILENEATTTKENMLYGSILMNRKTKFYGEKSIMLVTSNYHVKRTLLLGQIFLPQFAKLSACPAFSAESVDGWLSSSENLALLDTELYLLHGLYSHGLIPDTELAY